MRKSLLFTLLIIFAALMSANAQHDQEKFGRNRIQYEQFEWRYLSSENFDIYFYRGGNEIAKEVAEYLEDEFDRITDLIGYPPYSKTKIFLYNSTSDLQQSNVGIHDYGISIGGETQFIKPYIEVAHPGTLSELKTELIDKVSSLMVNEMMFGGSLKDMFQSSVLLNLPEWFISGAAQYVAYGWNTEMDDFIRDYINTKKPDKLSKLEGREAALAGQSLWNYIAEQYGRSNVSNILNYTRIIRNEEKSIGITLGVPFKQVIYNWQTYYQDLDYRVNKDYKKAPDDRKIVRGNNRKDKVYTHVKLNNQGTKTAYTENDHGKFKVIIKDLATQKENVALRGGYRVINQEVDYSLPLVDWADSATLGMIYFKQGKLWFELYDLNTNSRLTRQLRKFDNVQSMDFSDNGRLLIVSAMVDGQNDLYLLSTRRDRTKRLFYDVFDDTDVRFMPQSNTIVFSSNRTSDTLNLKGKTIEDVTQNYNIFAYSLDTTKNVLQRITNTISKDTHPIAYDRNTIYYLSDQKGIINIFSFDRESGIYRQVTNYESSIDDFDAVFSNNQLVYAMQQAGLDYVYYEESFDFEQQIFTPLTPRKQIMQVRSIKERRRSKQKETLTIQDIVESRLKERQAELEKEKEQLADTNLVRVESIQLVSDSLDIDSEVETEQDTVNTDDGFLDPEKDLINTDDYNFEPEAIEETQKQEELITDNEEENEVIDTDDYKFETDVLRESQSPQTSFLEQYRKLRQKNDISGPYPYEPRFSANNLVTSFRIDPLRGFGIFLQTDMYDMLQDHNFQGGVLAMVDLRSGDIFAEYNYLGSRLDYSARFERNVILRESDISLKKYSQNTFQVGAALPFNTKTRLEINPFYSFTTVENLDPIGGSPPRFESGIDRKYVGLNSELVYDNSIINGMNLIEGTRAKISFTHFEGFDDKDLSFSNIKVDIRHYQKIHREIVLASRLFYGSFFGRNPKQYLLGGMDNWVLNEENTEGTDNPLNTQSESNNDNLLFIDYATNLRGFDYATLFGRNTIVFNTELRIPVIRYLSSGPISSNFFRNLQFTSFFDIGSAWTGKSPFNEDNTISTEEIRGGNFLINIKNFQNPWLYSYGVGMRSMVLGYYLKLDLAYPVEDFETGDPRFLLTLGYDF